MALTLIKVAIKDPESADIVTLSNIMEGVDGSAVMGWEQEPESVKVEDGQTLDHSIMGTLDIKVLRASASDTAILDGLIGKRVELSGWTIEGFLLFRGRPYLNRDPDYNSDILNDRILVTTKAVKGYVVE